jgi:hypothetical protein
MGARRSRGEYTDRVTTRVNGMLRSNNKRGASLASEGRTRLPKTGGDGRAPAPDRIVNLAYAFWQSKALLSAVELGVFTSLAEGPLDLETLTALTGLHPRGARDFFDALAALGLLRRDAQGRYGNQPDTDQFLDRRKPTYVGALLEHLNARHFRNWSLLTQALRTGAPQSGALADGSYPALYSDAPMRDVFSDPLPRADVIVMGRILHNWDQPTRLLLLRKAQHALTPGGALIVYDPLIDDGRTLPHGLLSSLNMLIETKGGSEYSGAECADWMMQVGFRDVRIEPLCDVHSAVIGTRA